MTVYRRTLAAVSLLSIMGVAATQTLSSSDEKGGESAAGTVQVVPGAPATAAPAEPWGTQATAAAGASSEWARIVDGSLNYKTTANGDRIMDFSTAGFGGGGFALPSDVPVRVSLTPSGGDDTSRIQAAIDSVSARDRGTDRYRGAIRLSAGTFRISKSLVVNATGVVVAGSGSGTSGTIIQMTGGSGFLAFRFGASRTPVLSNTADLTSSYIKSGSNAVHVSSTAGFIIGGRVQISRPVTASWVHYLGMDTLMRDGAPQTWIAPGTVIATPRAVTAIDTTNKIVTLDAPLTDSFDATYLGSPVGTVSLADYPGRLSWVGLEHVRIAAPAGSTVYSGATFSNVIDGYLNDVIGQDLQNSFNVARDAQQITFEKVTTTGTVTQSNAAPTADFSVTGSQVLLNRCQALTTGNWAFVTGGPGVGPTVLLNFNAGSGSRGVAPHQRWYTGVLVDSSNIAGGSSSTPGIAFTNRGNLGTGHGWTTGWSVAWNVTTPYVNVQSAPGTVNWCIGCIGSRVSTASPGIFDSLGTKVAPASLYLQQLYERKGAASLSAIGYGSTDPTS